MQYCVIDPHPHLEYEPWGEVSDRLHEAGHDCRVVSFPGWIGDLPFRPGDMQGALVDAVVREIAELDRPLVLVGHDIGARLAMEIASLGNPLVHGVFALSPAGIGGPSSAWATPRLGSAITRWNAWIMPNALRAAVARICGIRTFGVGAVPDAYLDAFEEAFRDRRTADALLRHGGALAAEVLEREPSQPRCPVVLGEPRADWRVLPRSREWDIVRMPGGHSAHVARPGPLARELITFGREVAYVATCRKELQGGVRSLARVWDSDAASAVHRAAGVLHTSLLSREWSRDRPATGDTRTVMFGDRRPAWMVEISGPPEAIDEALADPTANVDSDALWHAWVAEGRPHAGDFAGTTLDVQGMDLSD